LTKIQGGRQKKLNVLEKFRFVLKEAWDLICRKKWKDQRRKKNQREGISANFGKDSRVTS